MAAENELDAGPDLMKGSREAEAPGMAPEGSIHNHSCKADPAAKDGREGGHNAFCPLARNQAKDDGQRVGGCHQVAKQVQADDVVALQNSNDFVWSASPRGGQDFIERAVADAWL